MPLPSVPKTYKCPKSNKDEDVWGALDDLVVILEGEDEHEFLGATSIPLGNVAKVLSRARDEIEQLEEIEELARELLKESWFFDKSEPCGSVARRLDQLLFYRWKKQ